MPPPTLDTLQTLRLTGRSHALVEQLQRSDLPALSCEDRFGLLVDRALTERANRRVTTRLRQAKLRQTAWIEALDYRHPRRWAQALRTRLATCQGARDHPNVLSTGPTGIGTTWRGCAGGQQACRAGLTTLSRRLPRFLPELPLAPGDGRQGTRRMTLAQTD